MSQNEQVNTPAEYQRTIDGLNHEITMVKNAAFDRVRRDGEHLDNVMEKLNNVMAHDNSLSSALTKIGELLSIGEKDLSIDLICSKITQALAKNSGKPKPKPKPKSK